MVNDIGSLVDAYVRAPLAFYLQKRLATHIFLFHAGNILPFVEPVDPKTIFTILEKIWLH